MFVKVCGVTSADAIEAAVAAGVDALGFVFARSPRELSPERAAALCTGLPPGILRVAVLRHPTAPHWERVREVFSPDWVQTDADDLVTMALPEGCRALPVVRNGEGAGALPGRILFEGTVSGSGRRADWDQAAELARRCELVLAGGLDPDNVTDAIRRVRPWGVDVSSGVESAPGRKDPLKIGLFVERARGADNPT